MMFFCNINSVIGDKCFAKYLGKYFIMFAIDYNVAMIFNMGSILGPN